MQDSMQLKVRIQWNQNITNRNEKTLTNGSDINTLVSTRRAWEVNWYPFRGKLWLHRLYINQGYGGEGKRDGMMSSSVHSPGTTLRRACRFPGFSTDYELAAMNAVTCMFPSTMLEGCRFHLGQAWWRHMQQPGLATTYKNKQCTESKWLLWWFGLSLLPATEVQEAFVEDLMCDIPSGTKFSQFADYVLETYVSEECIFKPSIWAHSPDSDPQTTNGAESYHLHLNEQFYTAHPNIYVFVEILLRRQTASGHDSELHIEFVRQYRNLICGFWYNILRSHENKFALT